MKPTNLRFVAFFALAMPAAAITMLALGQRPIYAKTALEMLRETPKPRFREGHTLLPLTRWGWTMAFDVRVELAEHWGYALEFGPYATSEVVKQLDDPKSVPSRLCKLTASDPKKYPLFVLTDRPFYDKKFLSTLPAKAWCHDVEGRLITNPQKQLSPEAPDEVFRRAGEFTAEPLKRIRQKAPIAIILNGGEYGLGVIGFAGPVWERDPAVVKAKGEKSWFDYISQRKARQELPVSQAVREAIPDRLLYVYYHTSGSAHRNRFADWWRWHWDYRWMKPVSDLASISIYYKDFNSGWTGANDMLTQALNSVGRDIALGQPLSYNWLCGGYTREKLGKEAFSDPEHYMGFLKCYYTAGMIGGVAGYFSYEKGGFEGELGDRMPSWLEQMIALAHAQALFSHLEDLIRNGDLLPGPDKHCWSKDQPAYEFPTGDKEARVVARRHKARPEWLITAWAAGGPDRPVQLTIPELGAVTLLARRCGTVYRATIEAGKPALVLMDRDGMFPTAEPGFTPLFDGKTLSGWTIDCLPKDKQFAAKAWTVQSGTILADTIGRRDHFYILLATDKEYGDFVLRLRFQVERGVRGNSGIQIRSRYNAETGWMEGPQIDINPPDPQTTGKLWNEGPGPHRWLSHEPIKGFKFLYADQGDGWNDLEITAKGMKIKSVLNGVTVVDYDGSGVLDDELHKKHNVGTKGVIGLQIHSYDELKLRFKDVRIKEL